MSNWKSIVTTARNDGNLGSIIQVTTELPSFSFEKFEFRTEDYFTAPIAPATVVWTTSEDFAPWTAVSSGMNVNTDNDKLTLNYSSGFAFPMAAITGLNINSDLYDTLQLVVKNSTEDTFLQMAANIPGTEFATGRKKITIPNDNQWHTIDVDLTNWSHWEGIITEFKVYESVNSGSIVFDRIEFIPIAGNAVFDVTITKEGSGILNYESGTSFGGQQFDLNAIADQGWVFQGWSGDVVSTENPLTITVNSNLNITATFTQDPLSVDQNSIDNAFTVFPNPSSNGVFTIKNNSTELWEVYSVTGVKVLSGKGKKIDISKFSNGMYIIKLNNSYKKILFY